MLPCVRVPASDDPIALGKRIASAELALPLQALDWRSVCGRTHLDVAMARALRSFAQGTNSARSLGVEMLLKAAMIDQISEAFTKVGARDDSTELVVYVLPSKVPDLSGPIRVWHDHVIGLRGDQDVFSGVLSELELVGEEVPEWRSDEEIVQCLIRLGVEKFPDIPPREMLLQEMTRALLG